MNDARSRLRPYIADHKTDGKDTVFMLEGFRDREEIERFMEVLEESGVLTSPKLQMQ